MMPRLSQAAKHGGDNLAKTEITCRKCGSKMNEVRRETHMAEADMDDLTEGQMADYMAAELSGSFGDWSITEITYTCPKCKTAQIISS